jgi:hypothetical protein
MKVADLTVDELKAIIRDIVDEALMDYDPDYGLELRPDFEARLMASLASADEGAPLDEVVKKLGLKG